MRKPWIAGFTIALFLVTVAVVNLSAQNAGGERFRVRYPRTNAIGGAHPTLRGDLSVTQNNPAALSRAEPSYQLATLGTTITGPVFAVSPYFLPDGDGVDGLLDDDEALDTLANINAGVDIAGPVGFGYTGNGIGFSIHNVTGISLSAPTSGTFELTAAERLVLRGGYAFGVPLPRFRDATLDLGLSIGAFIEGGGSERFPFIELADVLDDLGMDFALDSPFAMSSGFGFSLGMMYTYADDLSIAVTADNLYAPTVTTEYDSLNAFLDDEGGETSTSVDRAPAEINTGVRYSIPLGRVGRFIDEVDIYASYFDAFDFLTRDNPRNVLLKFALGTEVQLLDILRLRGGFSEGLLAAGAGLELGVLDFNGAVYGRELSSEPGLNSVYNVGFSVDVRL